MEPVAQITQLTEGFVLATADGTSVACTDMKSLVAAVRALLPLQGKQAPTNITPLPTRQEVKRALTQAPSPPEQTVVPAPSPASAPELAGVAGALPPEQVQNLHKMADACYRGLLQTSDITSNLEKYVPNLTRAGWNLFYSEYVADRRSEEDG